MPSENLKSEQPSDIRIIQVIDQLIRDNALTKNDVLYDRNKTYAAVIEVFLLPDAESKDHDLALDKVWLVISQHQYRLLEIESKRNPKKQF